MGLLNTLSGMRKNNKIYCQSLIIFLPFAFALSTCAAQQTKHTQYVDPMIGTGGHGHTFPGATVPFGMVQLSPDTRIDGSWDGCSGYHYSDSIIYGFSHTHLSGTGCSDYGDIVLFPTTENVQSADLLNQKFSSTFNHKNEKATAGYYSVALDNGVLAELTATTRVGFHKYTFPKSEFSYIILDLELRDKVINASATLRNNTTISGFRRSEAWAKDQLIMYHLEFSEPFIDAFTYNGSVMNQTKSVSGTKVRICFKFTTPTNRTIMAKVALSPVSTEGAEKNKKAELPHWDFEKTKKDAETLWDKELSKIEVASDGADQLKTFYTALYHTMIQPNVAMDVDGSYRGRDGKQHMAKGFTYYSVFSLWDTFRAAHPLYTIIDRQRTLDFIKTFLAQYKEGGRLPVWELASNETDCMIGYHSVSVIADAAAKGITDFDMNLALEAMKKSATWNHLGLPAYMDHGFLAIEDESESVSKTLEYAYDDWCIAQMAKMLNKQDDYNTYINRSQYWKNVFDPEIGFMRPKKNGGWLTPFDPREVNNNFTEGNSWQYTFFVPQDIPGLINNMGGPLKFEHKLDELFTTSNKTTGREQVDITGLIGQYAQGNEPSHHMAYLYDFVGKASKTQERIHQIINEFYKPTPDGLIGNEDCGQMSAWYILSSLGIYQVTPGINYFMLGTPSFADVKIHLENGKIFSMNATNLSKDHFYIQSIAMDGKKSNKNFIFYASIMKGSSLNFEMGDKPMDSGYSNLPVVLTNSKQIVPAPTIVAPTRVFKDPLQIALSSNDKNSKLYYTIDGSTPTTHSTSYLSPFLINKTTTIKLIAVNTNEEKSLVTSGIFYKKPHPDWKIKINAVYNPQYTAGGDEGIIDGIHGDINWRKGEWQGYQSQDFEAIIDLGKEQEILSCKANFLQDSKSWILMPVKVEFYTSTDDKNYTLTEPIANTIKPEDEVSQLKEFASSNKKVHARYVKVKAYNFGKLPAWHQGAGGDAFIFIDEIMIQ